MERVEFDIDVSVCVKPPYHAGRVIYKSQTIGLPISNKIRYITVYVKKGTASSHVGFACTNKLSSPVR